MRRRKLRLLNCPTRWSHLPTGKIILSNNIKEGKLFEGLYLLYFQYICVCLQVSGWVGANSCLSRFSISVHYWLCLFAQEMKTINVISKVGPGNYLGPLSKLSLQMSHLFLLSHHQSSVWCSPLQATFSFIPFTKLLTLFCPYYFSQTLHCYMKETPSVLFFYMY